MTKRRDWIKVRKDWWESPSHRLISAGARYFGVFLLYLADSDPDWRETGVGRLLAPDMSPLCSQDVATLSGSSLRNVRRWIKELERVGTLSRDENGALCFARYRDHQENRSSARVRKHRTKRYSNGKCNGDETTEEEEEAEGEEEGEEDLEQNTTCSVSSPSGDSENRRKPRKVRDLVDPMWDWFEAECMARGFARKARGLSAKERTEISTGVLRHIRSVIGAGTSREGTDRVIATMRAHLAWKLDQAELDRNSRKYIRTVAPWRRKSFDYWWAHVVDATEPSAPVGREPGTPEEAEAYADEHGRYPQGWTQKRGEWVRE